jgi:predicted neuraminidase
MSEWMTDFAIKTGSWHVETAEHVFADRQPSPDCHAPTLVELGEDVFVVAWFGGTEEGHQDVGIWVSRRSGGRWSAPVRVAKVREHAHWNPVLFAAPGSPERGRGRRAPSSRGKSGGPLHLFFKVGDMIAEWETWLTTSTDGGVSWSDPRELVPGDRGGRGPVKNKPIILSDGSWLAPGSLEPHGVGGASKLWDAFTDRSTDGGKTWLASALVPIDHEAFVGHGIIQPALWESTPGSVHMLLRSTAGAVYRSDSSDFGRTWSPAYRTALPNNNSGLDIARQADGALVLALNPVNVRVRTPLSLLVSRDNGQSWTDRLDIEADPDGRFAYPAIIPSGRGVAVAYSWNRTRIAFWKGQFEANPGQLPNP